MARKKAQLNNVPRGRVLKDDIIYELASIKPKSIDEINSMRSLSNGLRLKEEVKEEIIDNVLIGLSMKDKDLPKLPKKESYLMEQIVGFHC